MLAAVGIAAVVGACAEERAPLVDTSPPTPAEPTKAQAAAEEEAKPLGPAPTPLVGAERTGSTVALARLQPAAGEPQRLAVVADEDSDAVRLVDADALKEVAHHRLDGTPSQLAIGGDGRIWVALRDKSQVVGLEMAADGRSLKEVRRIDTPAEPVGLAVAPGGQTLAVSAAWGHELATYRIPDGKPVSRVPLAREPRGVAISDDGSYAYVAHSLGSQVSRVPLRGEASEVAALRLAGVDLTPIVRFRGCFLPARGDFDLRGVHGENNHHDRKAVQGFAVALTERDVFVPEVLVHRGEAKTGGYGTSSSYPTHQPALVQIEHEAVDAEGGGVSIRVMNKAFLAKQARERFAGGTRRDGCLLPRAAATDRERGTVLVSCLGTDEVLAFGTGREALSTSARGRWQVPAGPTGIAVDSSAGEALVWSQFAGELSKIPLPAARPEDAPKKIRYPSFATPAAEAVALGPLPLGESAPRKLSALAQEGRALFHDAGNPKLSRDGRACASCHPDGRDDGLTWPTPHGPRQTPMLAGRLQEATAPYGWQGDTATVAAHLTQTLERLGGSGLSEHEIAALVAYCNEMTTPPHEAKAQDAALAQRGEALFEDEAVGCAVCHTEDGVGSDGARHGVGSGPELETPSLAFVAGTAPYFHDGRYATLRELLVESKGKMGWGGHLSDDDLTAIEAYLRTL